MLVVLTDGKKVGSSAHPYCRNSTACYSLFGHSQQLLQRPLLEGLIGAVDDVWLKVVGSVVLNNIANVPDHWVVIVTPFKILKKTENGERGGG